MNWFICKFLTLIIFFPLVIFSQTPVENLDQSIFNSYASPFIEGTASNLNSGWVQRTPKAKMLSFDLELSLVGMGTMFKDYHKFFNSNADVKFSESTIDKMTENIDPNIRNIVRDSLIRQSFNVNVWGPTVIGPSDQTIKMYYPGDTVTINYNGTLRNVIIEPIQEDSKISGINFPVIPLGALQLSIGTLAGTKFSFRLIPPINLGNKYGKVFYYGGGVQHNPLVWFSSKKNEPAIDMSLAFFAQKLNVGSIFTSYGFNTGLYFSKTIGSNMVNITPYTGLTYEYNKTKINYEYDYTSSDGSSGVLAFNVNVISKDNLRYKAGVTFKLTVISLNFDYSYSKYHSLSAGFGFIF